MAIVRRMRPEYSPAEEAAILKFFRENPALDPKYEVHNANRFQSYIERWQVIVDGESLEDAFNSLSEAGVLKLRSEAQQKYDAAAQGYTQAQQDTLDTFLKRVHLVHDPGDDRTFANCSAFYQAMRGREFTHDNLAWVLQYIQGKGVRLHWEDRPSQVQHRAHIPTSRKIIDGHQSPIPITPRCLAIRIRAIRASTVRTTVRKFNDLERSKKM